MLENGGRGQSLNSVGYIHLLGHAAEVGGLEAIRRGSLVSADLLRQVEVEQQVLLSHADGGVHAVRFTVEVGDGGRHLVVVNGSVDGVVGGVGAGCKGEGKLAVGVGCGLALGNFLSRRRWQRPPPPFPVGIGGHPHYSVSHCGPVDGIAGVGHGLANHIYFISNTIGVGGLLYRHFKLGSLVLFHPETVTAQSLAEDGEIAGPCVFGQLELTRHGAIVVGDKCLFVNFLPVGIAEYDFHFLVGHGVVVLVGRFDHNTLEMNRLPRSVDGPVGEKMHPGGGVVVVIFV